MSAAERQVATGYGTGGRGAAMPETKRVAGGGSGPGLARTYRKGKTSPWTMLLVFAQVPALSTAAPPPPAPAGAYVRRGPL